MADCFRLFYKNICCDLCCCQRCERKRKRERAIARRRKAAQRNSLLRQTTSELGYQGTDELDPECHSLRDEIPLAIEDIPPDEQTEDDREGEANNDDIEQAAGGTKETLPPPYQATVADETLPVRETAILDDNIDDDDDDGIKETAILDSDTDDDDDDKAKNKTPKTPQTPVIDWDNIENFADARETAILDDEDDDEEGVFLPTSEALPAPALNGGASDDMDTIPLATATDEANVDDTDGKKKKKRGKSRSKSREKKEQKLAEKRREKEKKEREKKEKERLKREKKEAEKESKKSKKTKRDRSKDKKGSDKSQTAFLAEPMDNSGFAHDDGDTTLPKDSTQNSKTADKDAKVSDASNDKNKPSGENSIQDSKKSKKSVQSDTAENSKGCDDTKDSNEKKDSVKKKNSDKKKESDKKKVKEKEKERPSSLKEKTRFDNKVTMLGKSRDKPTSRSLKEPPHSILKDRSPSRKGAEALTPSTASPTALFPLPHPSGIIPVPLSAKDGKLSRGKSTKKSFKGKNAQKALQRRELMRMLILEGARREKLKAQQLKSGGSTKRSFSAEDMNHLGTSSDLKNTDRHYGSDESFVTAKSESFAQDELPPSPDHTSEKLLSGDDCVVTTQPDSMAVSIDQNPYDLFDLGKESGAIGYDDPFDFGESESQEKVTVPISICLIIIAGYIFGGSMLFALWEEWDYLTGSYFCFITLSTIGFGDIVPGTDVSDWGSHEKLVLCALWLAFGLSLLAMCFNLMQEEVKEKCKWVGQKLGLLRDDDDT